MEFTNRLRGLLLPALAVLPAACGVGQADDAQVARQLPEVTIAPVSMTSLRDWADFTGRIEAVETVEVRPRVSGFVESVHFTEGGPVDQGDLLFQIDPRPFRAEVDRLTAERHRAEAELSLARTYRARAERLLAQNVASEEEFERYAADEAVGEADLAAVEAALESAELDLSFTRVTSPITGRVSSAIVTPGNLADSSTLLTTVVSDNPVYAYFDVDEHTYLDHVRESADQAGASVHVGLINEEGHPHAAALDFVDNQVNPAHGTIRARAVLDNSDGRFTPGLFIRLKLVSPRSDRVALIDDRAIGTDLGRKFVLVVDEANVAQYRAVETGRLVNGLRVVTGGLAPGDDIIVNGLQRARPGATVSPERVAMDGDPPSLPRHLTDDLGDSQVAQNIR
jgi:RND family efflux transporter MFP subunit